MGEGREERRTFRNLRGPGVPERLRDTGAESAAGKGWAKVSVYRHRGPLSARAHGGLCGCQTARTGERGGERGRERGRGPLDRIGDVPAPKELVFKVFSLTPALRVHGGGNGGAEGKGRRSFSAARAAGYVSPICRLLAASSHEREREGTGTCCKTPISDPTLGLAVRGTWRTDNSGRVSEC